MSALPVDLLPSAVPSQLDVSQALPGYSHTISAEWNVPAAEQEHKSYITRKTGERWLMLSVKSRATSEAEQPTFFQGGLVAGSVCLLLDKEERIDELAIRLYGRLTIFSHSTSNFLCMTQTLYSAAQHIPQSSPSTTKRGRLNGQHHLSFSFRLPKGVSILSTIDVKGEGERRAYRLPPSFADKESNAHVQYSLVVRVNRGGFRAGKKLVVPINYKPLARPSAPTILRQLAYQRNTAVMGPEGDPDGWKAAGPVRLEGMLFNTISVEAWCRLFIARPLTYTRGGPIHLLISIENHNAQFLDLVTSQSIHLSLIQRVTFGEEAEKAPFSRRLSAKLTVKSYIRATACWWRMPSPPSTAPKKMFAGEIVVPDDLTPACQILHYGHEFELVLYSLTAVGFISSAPPKTAHLSESVGIVTAFAEGPRPRSYIPPKYDA